jgi:DNA-binding SARP family transcriptional activator/predicted negative regulator of RcsB-dependent stress response
MTLEITLLGRPQLNLNGHPVPAINANKALALLYYLAATGHTHSRQSLAGLLWSDLPEEAARRNLRVELNRLRNVIAPYLVGSRETLAFNRDLPHELDLSRFERCLRQPEPTTEQLREAIALYRGEFLEDFHVRDAALFEEWQASERERLRQAVQRLTLRLIKLYSQGGEYDLAIPYAHALLAREPWLEEGHQQLMLLYARTGQRGNALAQYELCAQALDDEFGVPPSDETNELYDQILSGEIGPDVEQTAAHAAIVAPPRPVAPPFQAPAPVLHFVGREQQLEMLSAAMLGAADQPMIFALIGMGGVGKSTLAIHLAHALRAHFPDGVLWAHVANSDPLDVLNNWARALGYDFSGLHDVENRAAALRGVLADRRILLVMDDVRSVARTRPLLVGGPHAVTLLTTRDLDVAIALGARPSRLDELTAEAGIRLLARILGEERVAAEPEAAHNICTLLQHLPLAVEITAQRLVSRPRRRLADMAERLRTVNERLDLSISDRAVRTSFEVSWEALDTNLRRVFALLGVFEGRAFEVSALAHIAGLDRYTAEDRLFALTALSLVSEEAENRYRQHPLLADFACEQIGENTLPFVDMALYYLQFAEQNRTNYPALRPEWENLMAGVQTAHRLGQWPLVLNFAEVLTQAWFVRARYTQARQGYALAQVAAESLGDRQALATVLLRWGQACVEQDDYEEAKELVTASLQWYQQIEHEAGIADAEYMLGRIAVEQGEYHQAERHLLTSRQIREQLGDTTGIAATLYQEALLSYRRTLYDRAKELCEQALAMQHRAGDEAGTLPTLRLLVDVALEQQAYAAANAYCQQALTLCERLQDRGELAATYYSAAVVARFQQQLEQAQRYAEQAMELCRWMGNRNFLALTLYELSRIKTSLGELDQAVQIGLESLQLTRELGHEFSLVYSLRHLGDLYRALGQHDEAHALWQEALSLTEGQDHPLAAELRLRLNEFSGDVQPA